MPISIKTKSPLKPRYPVREWLGKYQAYRLTLHRGRYWLDMCKCLEKFFELNPGLTGLEMFTSANVLDYFLWRSKTCMLSTILKEVKHVKYMWNYLIEVGNLPLLNPIRPKVLAAIKAASLSKTPDPQEVTTDEVAEPRAPIIRNAEHYGLFTQGIF